MGGWSGVGFEDWVGCVVLLASLVLGLPCLVLGEGTMYSCKDYICCGLFLVFGRVLEGMWMIDTPLGMEKSVGLGVFA